MKQINKGLQSETTFINAFNGKTYPQLGNNLKVVARHLYSDVDDTSVFSAVKSDPRGKPDMTITYKEETHYVSLKSGADEIVHAEDIVKFLSFLNDHGVSQRTQDTLRLFQYGDGTLDGTGAKRLGYEELMPILAPKIREANIELECDKALLLDLADRLVFQGNYHDLPAADLIYHGTVDYGVSASITQIKKHLTRRSFSFYNSPHIGPFHPRPYARYLDFSDPYPEKRNIMNFKWMRLYSDIAYIGERYDD